MKERAFLNKERAGKRFNLHIPTCCADFDGVVDFVGNEKSMAFSIAALARGSKLVVSSMMGGTFTLPVLDQQAHHG